MKYAALLLVGLTQAFLLQGCSLVTPPVDLTPEETQREIQKRNGYKELKKPAAEGKVKLIFRGEGEKNPVTFPFSFAMSTSTEWCKGLEIVGKTRDPNLVAVWPWFVPLEQGHPRFLVREIDAPESGTVQVQSIAHTGGSCGEPRHNRLVTQPGHTYLVRLIWTNSLQCMLRLEDVTNNADVPVPAKYRSDTPRANTWSGFASCPWGGNP